MKTFALTAAALFFIGICSSMAADSFPAAHVIWGFPTGMSSDAPETSLSLVARDFLHSHPESGVGGGMFGAASIWLRDHPKAVVLPIAVLPAIAGKMRPLSTTFVWVTDGEENLNLSLVEQGCFSSDVQSLPESQALEIPRSEYVAFLQKAAAAEARAKQKKLGLWKPVSAVRKNGPILASDVTWMGHLGTLPGNSKKMLCLMCTGFFLSPTDDLPAASATWMNAHPKAIVIPVWSMEMDPVKHPGVRWTFVWVVDGRENLNVEMVRQGRIDPSTQIVEKAQELEAPKADYEAFIKEVDGAAEIARDRKLGIWKNDAG